MSKFVEAALPGRLALAQKRYRTRRKDPINFSAVARSTTPPLGVVELWGRVKPFLEGKEN